MNDCCAQAPGLLDPEEAMRQLLDQAQPLTETETLSLPQALGRVLATPIDATLDVPPHDNSAMDGYALRHADLGVSIGEQR